MKEKEKQNEGKEIGLTGKGGIGIVHLKDK